MTKLNEALEKSLSRSQHQQAGSTPSTNAEGVLTSTLYRGVLSDYITCQECGFSRTRHDAFVDVPLAVQGVSSVTEALQLYTTPDILTGDNRWFCETCDHKVDALKGLGFKDLPYFLTLQLKRFAYDPATWRRIKLNDRISFPLKLDMSPFVPAQQETPRTLEYELFSVMIHSGGAMGGHYYAFIKSFESGKWIKFNDASGTARQFTLSPSSLRKTYNGSNSLYSISHRRK